MQLFDKTADYQQPNLEGYYGEFGGAYIPEMLYGNVEELKKKYLEIMSDPDFQNRISYLIKRLCR
jgi:tryptophan synthase beta chain